MTGHQNNPANGLTIKGDPTAAVDLEALARAVGIRRVRVVDPFDVEGTRKAIGEELEAEEPSLVISRRPCALLKTVKAQPALRVDEAKCVGWKACLTVGCPRALNTRRKAVNTDYGYKKHHYRRCRRARHPAGLENYGARIYGRRV